MRIGFVGTGLMGNPMAAKIIEAGFKLSVYNRTRSKLNNLVELGASVADSLVDLASESDTIISMLSNADSFEQIFYSNEIHDLNNKTIIQMSTIAPQESMDFEKRINKLDGEYFEAPVLGSIPQIAESKLIVMVGGSVRQFEKFKKLFESFSNKIVYVGEVGKATALKLALNQFIISETVAFSISLGYVRESEIDINLFMDILKGSALYAPTFEKKLDNMLIRNFDNPNFPLKHLLKDLDLMLNEFGKNKIETISLKGIRKILLNAIEMGYAEQDYSALYNSVHKKSES
jgi:3-hydroxyisobutyrate dehydrogenase